MSKSLLSNIINVLLVVLGGYMIYLGNKAGMRPPTVTGVGFILIAIALWFKK